MLNDKTVTHKAKIWDNMNYQQKEMNTSSE